MIKRLLIIFGFCLLIPVQLEAETKDIKTVLGDSTTVYVKVGSDTFTIQDISDTKLILNSVDYSDSFTIYLNQSEDTTIKIKDENPFNFDQGFEKPTCPYPHDSDDYKVYRRGSWQTAMACGNSYWDEEGDYHSPEPCNISISQYECSEGHRWEVHHDPQGEDEIIKNP